MLMSKIKHLCLAIRHCYTKRTISTNEMNMRSAKKENISCGTCSVQLIYTDKNVNLVFNFFFLNEGIIWHTVETLRPQCLHLLSESRWGHSTQQDLLMFVDTLPSKCRQITPLNDRESIKQQKTIKEHCPNHLQSKVLPSYRQQNTGHIWVQKYKKFSYFTILCSVVPPSYLSRHSAKLLTVIYDRIGSMHRYDELKNMKLLFEHLKGRFIKNWFRVHHTL